MPASSTRTREATPELACNVADRLAKIAAQQPDAVAVATPGGRELAGARGYTTATFGQLDADATAFARGLVELGVKPGMRLALLVKPGVEFVKLVFALLRSGATTVFVDPGMGRTHLIRCLQDAQVDGFVAISAAQAVRTILRRRFSQARINVTVGRRWFWGGLTYRELLDRGRTSAATLPPTVASDSAAIIFTSGSTGPPKGVQYTHGMFDAQAAEIQAAYGLSPGGVDLACFALFGLFNAAWGVTTVFPDMDFSRPAAADPRKLLAAAGDWRVTQAFASPAIWDKLSRHCERTRERLPALRKVFSCGAPVRAEVIRRTLDHVAGPGAEMHTPYGATEALPVSTIEAHEILGETAAATSQGAGVCVGRKVRSIEWRVVAITDEAIVSIEDAELVPTGEIGELIVRGPQVSSAYMANAVDTGANSLAKIADGLAVWHRMGDVGYLDDHGRFWYCGRKSHRVQTRNGPLFSVPIEAVFDALPSVRRSALVGVGPPGNQLPVMTIELEAAEACQSAARRSQLITTWYDVEPRLLQLWYAPHGLTPLEAILFHPSLPVDVRHNAKINREALAAWATGELKRARRAV